MFRLSVGVIVSSVLFFLLFVRVVFGTRVMDRVHSEALQLSGGRTALCHQGIANTAMQRAVTGIHLFCIRYIFLVNIFFSSYFYPTLQLC